MLYAKALPKDFKVYELGKGKKKTTKRYAFPSGLQSLGSFITTDKIQHAN